MEQEFKTISATALATDLGEFTAIAAAWTVDREKDQIHPGAFAGTIKHWRRSGKQLPLHWDHKGGPENVIGHIDPQSMRETEEGLLVKGKLDIENSDMAKEAWRLVKSGTVGLSFGYLVPEGGETKRAGGGRDLSELDVFEISVTPAPMNPDTRILSAKSLEQEVKELRRQTEQQQRQLMEAKLPEARDIPEPEPEPEPVEELPVSLTAEEVAGLRRMSEMQQRELVKAKLPETKQVDEPPSDVQLRILKSMIGQAQEYIASNPDPEDAAEMADVLETLEELVGEPDTEDEGPGMMDDGKSLRSMLRKMRRQEQPGWIISELKAVWTTAYVNNLPDSAFLHIEPGGSKDNEGKTTPRSLRYFPVKDATGAVDLPHLRNALARIPQSSLSQSVKDAATAEAQRLLNAQKSVSAPADPNRRRIERAMLDFQSDGVSSRKSPPVEEKREAQAPPEDQLRRQTRDQYLEILTSTRSW